MSERRTHQELADEAAARLQRLIPNMAPEVRSNLADVVAASVEQQESA
jgi:hypothetical protein